MLGKGTGGQIYSRPFEGVPKSDILHSVSRSIGDVAGCQRCVIDATEVVADRFNPHLDQEV